MSARSTTDVLEDAETLFRRRLREKLLQRGVPEAEIEGRINEILRKGLNIKWDVAAILGEG